MIAQSITIRNASGLHARPAANFITTAKQFKSDIRIRKGDRLINGKSIVAILSAGITVNAQITLEVNGEDEAEALACLIAAIESGLGE